MNAEQAIKFLACLGTKATQKDKNWVVAPCPLAPFTHKNGKDSHPSFGFSIREGERSHFNCFTCQSGSAEELLGAVELYQKKTIEQYNWTLWGYDFKTARMLLDEEEVSVLPLPKYSEFQQGEGKVFEAWPEYVLGEYLDPLFIKDAAGYLKKRGVPTNQYTLFKLRYDPDKKMIVFPYWDVYGRFAGMRGRSIEESPKLKHYDYTWNKVNNAGLVWYNETALNLLGPVVVVEGQFDALRVAQKWPKVVANLTAKPTHAKILKLQQCNQVILIPDSDEAGVKSVSTYQVLLGAAHVKLSVLYLDPDTKDPDECHPDYLYDRIQQVAT